ncbi:MAG: DNA mismatch repair protein MutS [Candidatus Saganbacteria bacterium]|uniref:DNA mismatch repair protein MutS n=1 Tax=Candidatus Saganbacteria bacterium TaxID=2575572 RepID=A0A833L0A2_UNCSA|nr:MAG: DNA mismatch repair protein MutS [Candidatus Saganbacteria bacterium]
MSEATPMIKQYLSIKQNHLDAILFFRLGDFYEMFYDDAEVASRELDLVLTGRGVEENRMPMCGIPYHAANNYISKLIGKGYKVAICEQVEDPKTAKGVVKREVIKIFTPGTVIEASYLSEKTNNYLLAVTKEKDKYGLAYADASTGEFKTAEILNLEKLMEEISRINPSEILVSDIADIKTSLPKTIFKDIYDTEAAEEKLKSFFKVQSLDSFGLDEAKAGWGAAAAIIDYLIETQKTSLGHINYIQPYHSGEFMFIDSQTRKNLELVQTAKDKSFKGSLLWALDKTKTSMGARILRQWVLQPLLNREKIEMRLDAVQELYDFIMIREELSKCLKSISDIERVIARIASQSANARDLIALKESLSKLPALKNILSNSKSTLLKAIQEEPEFLNMINLISSAIAEDPPLALKEGGIIKDGFNQELNEIKKAAREGKEWIKNLENEERKKTGIKSLKVGFTRVFGYYIEVTKSNLDQVPENYIRKQTLINCERYITPELKEKESLILNADERMKEMEYKVFCDVRQEIAFYTRELQKSAAVIAQIDVLLSLAETAVFNNYNRPQITENSNLLIVDGRHPVVEKMQGEQKFVPNDIDMDQNESRFLLITGPNMAGKSTYMRQTALICLMAQIGSFVPAKESRLSLIDRIFTRIGAMDDIFSGQSTFMLEMTETANILNNATSNSLIILDEIGRGTATFDGMAIAASTAEYIHKNIKAKTLFATHYHEITQLADKHPGMKNLNVLAKEENDKIIFLHKIVDGTADRSYGIQVAKLAGLPKEVVSRAKEIYNTLEMVENDLGRIKTKKERPDQINLF